MDSSGKVNVPWVDTSLGNSEVFLSRSADGSATFSTPLNISNDSGKCLEPQIGVDSSGSISVAWADNTPSAGSGFFDVLFLLQWMPFIAGGSAHLS